MTGTLHLAHVGSASDSLICFLSYDVYIVTDASAGTSKEAHDMAVQRMIQAGAIPVTWIQVLLEYQRDWSRREHYDEGAPHSSSSSARSNLHYSHGARQGARRRIRRRC